MGEIQLQNSTSKLACVFLPEYLEYPLIDAENKDLGMWSVFLYSVGESKRKRFQSI